MGGVDQFIEFSRQVAQVFTDLAQLALPSGATVLDASALHRGGHDRVLQPGEYDAGRRRDLAADLTLPDQPLPARHRSGPGLPLGLGSGAELVGATLQPAGALLGGPQLQSGIHLGLSGRPGLVCETLALGGVRFLIGCLVGCGQPGLEFGQPGLRLLPSRLGGLDLAGQSLSLTTSRTRRGAVLGKFLSDTGHGRVRLVQPAQRGLDPLDRLVASLIGGLGLEREAFHVVIGPHQRVGGFVHRRLNLDQTWCARRATRSEVSTDQVAVLGHRHHVGKIGHQTTTRGKVINHRSLEQQPGQRTAQIGRHLDHVGGEHRPGRQARPVAPRGLATPQDDAGPTEVVGLEVTDRRDRRISIGGDDRVSGVAQRSRDRGLVAGAHTEQRSHRAEQAGQRAGRRQQRPGSVLAVEAEFEGLLAGLQ